jgi:NAD(P)-dependent dehydrogenase (short-subunit alcohol dehydrogenase family)
MPTVLITGANRGLGLEFARQYAADGWRIIATCRDPEKAIKLAKVEGDVTIHQLDVANFDAIKTLAQELDSESIDLLLNNAGIIGAKPWQFGDTDYQSWAETIATNAMGPLKMCECFVEQVARSDLKQMISISTHLGSMGRNTDGAMYIYRSSKAALNAVMKSVAIDLKEQGISVAVYHPGWARTGMGGPNAAVDPVDSVTGIRKLTKNLKANGECPFLSYDDTALEW